MDINKAVFPRDICNTDKIFTEDELIKFRRKLLFRVYGIRNTAHDHPIRPLVIRESFRNFIVINKMIKFYHQHPIITSYIDEYKKDEYNEENNEKLLDMFIEFWDTQGRMKLP